ncbi:MAG: S8 family serine peptidase, partial [Crocosphaera sp.]
MVFNNQGQRMDGNGQAIVIIDTGIDLNHPFFGPDLDNNGVADRIVYHYDFAGTPLQNTNDPTSNDDNDASDPDSHGSHVASIAASSDANYEGMAPGADIIVLKVFDPNNQGNFFDIEQALQWVVANEEEYNIASVNMSLSNGGNYANPIDFGIIGDELQQLAQEDVIVVSAAGNTGQFGVSYPAANLYSLAVSSVDDYTNRQISSFSQHHPDLTDVFADGNNIRAANQNGGTTVKSGTSMAAPAVSGAIAVAQQLAEQELARRLTFDEIKTLLSQGDDVVGQYADQYQGKVLNIEKLGNAILDLVEPPTDIVEPPTEMVIAQVGEITDFDHNSQTIVFDQNLINPVIFAQPLSYNGHDASTVRITDIQGDRFSVQLQESDTLDGIHTKESSGFLVFEKGIWELSDGTIIEVGTVTTDATTISGWESITFTNNFDNAPIVLTQVQTNNDETFVQTRQNNITENGFELALEKEEAYLNTEHGAETIAWLAISPGTGNWDGNAFMAGNTGDQVTDNWHTINFGNTFNNAPKLFGNIVTYDGGDPSGLRTQNLSNGSVQIKIDEDISNDSEVAHTTENINYFAIEATGTLKGSENSDAITGLVVNQVGTTNNDTFVVGNSQESLYDTYGQQDYLEISGFNSSQDVIQLYG